MVSLKKNEATQLFYINEMILIRNVSWAAYHNDNDNLHFELY